MYHEIRLAVSRSLIPIVLMLCLHTCAVIIGGIMVHNGNEFALRTRDRLVARAHAQDPASLALAKGHRLKGAVWDFGRNLVLGGIPSTVGGLAIVVPYLTGILRGWVGGIVSVDYMHMSRLKDSTERIYYLVTLFLQIIPYSLAGGVGVRLGLEYLRSHQNTGSTWLGLPLEALHDVMWVYTLVLPLFAIASLWEFLMR